MSGDKLFIYTGTCINDEYFMQKDKLNEVEISPYVSYQNVLLQ